MGIAPRAELHEPEQAQRYIDMGVKHFCLGSDVSVLFNWFKANGKSLRDTLGIPALDAETTGYDTGAVDDQ